MGSISSKVLKLEGLRVRILDLFFCNIMTNFKGNFFFTKLILLTLKENHKSSNNKTYQFCESDE
jgi:hypothetical protein